MDYTHILHELQSASFFDLFRLQAGIEQQLEDPTRIAQVKARLHPGMAIEYFDTVENRLIEADIIELRRTRVLIQNHTDGKRWLVRFCAVNLDEVPVDLRPTSARQPLDRSLLRVGDLVGFQDKQNREQYGRIQNLNPKTAGILTNSGHRWRVAYPLLFKVLDIDTEAAPQTDPEVHVPDAKVRVPAPPAPQPTLDLLTPEMVSRYLDDVLGAPTRDLRKPSRPRNGPILRALLPLVEYLEAGPINQRAARFKEVCACPFFHYGGAILEAILEEGRRLPDEAIRIADVMAEADPAQAAEYQANLASALVSAGRRERPSQPAEPLANRPTVGAHAMSASSESPLSPAPFVNADKIGVNDPCPCGSGKKYKKCCKR